MERRRLGLILQTSGGGRPGKGGAGLCINGATFSLNITGSPPPLLLRFSFCQFFSSRNKLLFSIRHRIEVIFDQLALSYLASRSGGSVFKAKLSLSPLSRSRRLKCLSKNNFPKYQGTCSTNKRNKSCRKDPSDFVHLYSDQIYGWRVNASTCKWLEHYWGSLAGDVASSMPIKMTYGHMHIPVTRCVGNRATAFR
ncbi:hypothetical protein BUALT_Bualt10G0081100 [Buddleja alternifolia]|uniref:Uncharacterized protein n=1 Tax=Buddleja alternifolia TaxID=168488 RepID=A0AAV6WY40_9LAMI|nr:hypothetical protein BUALT_Bualt10G0081100 [Buddleja alternifolia]